MGRPLGSPAHGETARPPYPLGPGWKQPGSSWASGSHHFLQPTPRQRGSIRGHGPGHKASARRGLMLIKRGPGTGRKSSQPYDDDSSSQARPTDTSRQRLRDPLNQDRPGYEQQQHGISRTRTMAGHNPADDRPADGQPFLLPSGPLRRPDRVPRRAGRARRVDLRPRPAIAGHRGPPGHRRRASAAVAWTRGRRARQRAEHRADLALRPGALRDPRPGKSPTSRAGPTRSSPTARKAATSTSTPN